MSKKFVSVLRTVGSLAGTNATYKVIDGVPEIRGRYRDSGFFRFHMLKDTAGKPRIMANDDLKINVQTKPFLHLFRGLFSPETIAKKDHYDGEKVVRIEKTATPGILSLRFKKAACDVRERNGYFAADVSGLALKVALIKAVGMRQVKGDGKVSVVQGSKLSPEPGAVKIKPNPCG